MQTIKIKRKINSLNLRISELKEFIGKTVEITVSESSPAENIVQMKSASGILSAYKNPGKIKLEKDAWGKAVVEKHKNN